MSNLYETPLAARAMEEEDDDVAEFYLKDKSQLDERSEIALLPENEVEVVSSMVEVPGSFYENPSALDDNKEDLGALAEESKEDLGEQEE